jgi:hypothetical protein
MFGREWRVSREDFEDWINVSRARSQESQVEIDQQMGEI